MPDDLTSRGGQDRQRIDVNQDYELRDWSKRFGVTREQLKEAVQAVGTRAERVEEFLKSRSERRGSAPGGEHAGGGRDGSERDGR
jgi:hypothetical protein